MTINVASSGTCKVVFMALLVNVTVVTHFVSFAHIFFHLFNNLSAKLLLRACAVHLLRACVVPHSLSNWKSCSPDSRPPARLFWLGKYQKLMIDLVWPYREFEF